MKPVLFKLDTGADFTTIEKRDLIDFGYSYEWIKSNAIKMTGNTTTATDQPVDAYYVKIPLINIYGYEAKN